MKLIYIVGLVTFGFILQNCGDTTQEITTIYLVRHAEKDLTDSTDNPPLTEVGYQRADNLATTLKDVHFNGLFSTDLHRTKNTLLPLAQQQNITIVDYPYYDWQTMLDSLKITYQKNYLIGGHGDNLLEMIDYLQARRPQPSLGKHEYDNIFKVSISKDSSWVDVIKY